MKNRNMLQKWLIILFLGLITQAVSAQNVNVHGVITDETGETMIGVSVLVKGTSTGVVTDINGHFSLSVPKNSVLSISYIGYKSQEISVNGAKKLNIEMEPEAQNLDEVVIVAYGQQKKVSVTGSMSSINNEALLKSPSASLGNAISGKLPGLSTVQYSGLPGADDPVILIRGQSSFNGSSPLVLVDGVERSFTQIDPNEVADITVLKDASATAVYGVRGANGVILVTTKRGEVGRTKVSASTSWGVQSVTNFIDMANSYTYATAYNNARISDGNQPAFQPAIIDHFKNHDNPLLYPDIDWIDYVMKDHALQSQHNISVSGGNQVARYFVSAGFLDQDGLFRSFDKDSNTNFSYKRYNYRANLDLSLGKYHELSINLGGRVENKHSLSSSEERIFVYLMDAQPFSGAGIIDGRWVLANRDLIDPTGLENIVSGIDGLDTFYGQGYTFSSTNVLNADINYKLNMDFLTTGLDFRVKASYNSSYGQTKDRTCGKPASFRPYLTENGEVVYQRSGDYWNPGYSESAWSNRDWYAEASFDWKRDFDLHHLSALVLYNQSKAYYPDSDYPGIPRGYVGLVGRVTYDYDNKYLIEGNVGYNGSENFAPGNRYGLFPAVSGGWVLTQEEFLKDNPVVDFLKIRASYGVVGNDRYHPYGNNFMDRFLYLPNSYFIGGGYQFGTGTSWTPGAYEKSFGNSGLSWEKSAKQNYGIDFSLFGQKLSGSIDYFYERREDILAKASTDPIIHAMSLPVLNLGIVSNKGVELNLKWNHKLEKLRYWANLNVSYAKNKIVYQDEVPSEYEYTLKTGHPVGQPFGLKVRGFYYEGMENIADHSYVLKEGDVVYEDLNNDGKIDDNDKTALGYPSYPLLNAGLTLGFEYKGFDFSMLWVGATKTSRVLQETFRKPLGETNDRSLMLHQFEDRWTPETAATAKLPRATIDGVKNNYRDSELWVKDASYLRLKNIEIGYNFRLPFMPKIGMEKMRVFMTGYNLLTFDKLKISDPESMSSGVPQYPVMRVINFGLNVSF